MCSSKQNVTPLNRIMYSYNNVARWCVWKLLRSILHLSLHLLLRTRYSDVYHST